MRTCATFRRSLVFLVALAFAVVGSAEVPTNSSLVGGVYPNQLKYLGAIEGKSFFLEDALKMNFYEAAAYCRTYNLKPAAVETVEQNKFLIKALRDAGYTGEAEHTTWTGGRFLPFPSNFLWEDRWTRVNDEAVTTFGHTTPEQYNYCLRLYLVADSELHYFGPADCMASYNVLCDV